MQLYITYLHTYQKYLQTPAHLIFFYLGRKNRLTTINILEVFSSNISHCVTIIYLYKFKHNGCNKLYYHRNIYSCGIYTHNNIHSITTKCMRFHRKFIPCAINIIYEGTYTILTLPIKYKWMSSFEIWLIMYKSQNSFNIKSHLRVYDTRR